MRNDKGTLSWSRTCLAVDAAGGSTVVVMAETVRGRVRLTRLQPSARPLSTSSRIPVVAALPTRRAVTRWLEAPLASPAKALRVLPTVLDIQLPFPLEDCIYAFLQTEKTADNATRALAVAARRGDVSDRLAELEALGFDPFVLDHEGLALWTQSLREHPAVPADETWRVLVCLRGEDSAVAIGRGTRFVAAHGIRETALEHAVRLLTVHLEHTADTQENDRRTEGATRVQWIWAGAGAADDVRLAAARNTLLARWAGTDIVVKEPGEFAVRALATRALLPGPLRTDLRRNALAHPQAERRTRKASVRAALAVGLSGLVLGAAGLAASLGAAARMDRVNQSFASTRDELLGYRLNVKGAEALKRVRTKLKQDRAANQAFLRRFDSSLTGVLESILATARRENLRYATLTVERGQVIISGTAADWDAAPRLVRVLADAGYDVKLDRKSILEDDRVPFTIEPGGAHE